MIASLRHFVKTTILGGIAVLLPVLLFVAFYRWLFLFLTGLIDPLTEQVKSLEPSTQHFVAQAIVLALLVLVSFLVGLLVRTRIGQFAQNIIDSKLLRRFPGYSLIKETLGQFFGGRKKMPFSAVALVQVFGNETMMTGFVTDEHEDGRTTVYVPACPNPIAGNVYHLPNRFVHKLEGVRVEAAMRTILSCGGGASGLFRTLKELRPGWKPAPADPRAGT